MRAETKEWNLRNRPFVFIGFGHSPHYTLYFFMIRGRLLFLSRIFQMRWAVRLLFLSRIFEMRWTVWLLLFSRIFDKLNILIFSKIRFITEKNDLDLENGWTVAKSNHGALSSNIQISSSRERHWQRFSHFRDRGHFFFDEKFGFSINVFQITQ